MMCANYWFYLISFIMAYRLIDSEDASDPQIQEQSQPADVTNKHSCFDEDDSVISPPSKASKHHNTLEDTILAEKLGMLA